MGVVHLCTFPAWVNRLLQLQDVKSNARNQRTLHCEQDVL
jgi:hypothetical protein